MEFLSSGNLSELTEGIHHTKDSSLLGKQCQPAW